jgi:aspartyl-tRNA(Asn)/glutamyl-tRNA(Gln) amidotransferase subunit C
MAVPPEEVRRLAKLARLRFSPDDETRLAGEMTRILDYIDQLKEVDVDGVEPLLHVLDLENVFRPDEATQRITREQALQNAPKSDGDYVRVPKVID